MSDFFGGLYTIDNSNVQSAVLSAVKLVAFTHASPSFGCTPDIPNNRIQIDEQGFWNVDVSISFIADAATTLTLAIHKNGVATGFQSPRRSNINQPGNLTVHGQGLRCRAGDLISLSIETEDVIDLILSAGQFEIDYAREWNPVAIG